MAHARACPRYSKRLSEVQNRHDANNCRLCAYWRHLGNTIEPSVCDGDAALCQLNYFDHLLLLGTPLPTRSRLLTSDHSVSLSFRSFVPLVSRFLDTPLLIRFEALLWSPYGIGQTVIFSFCRLFFFLLFFFRRLISAATDWTSAILPHMVWL